MIPDGSVSAISMAVVSVDPSPVLTAVNTYVSSPLSSPGTKFVGDEVEVTLQLDSAALAGPAIAKPIATATRKTTTRGYAEY
jgi:hypothetical protein